MPKPKRGVMMVELKVGETLELEPEDHARAGLDTQKISLTLVSKTGQRARFALQAAKVTRQAKQT
jgi:hypothetical protein